MTDPDPKPGRTDSATDPTSTGVMEARTARSRPQIPSAPDLVGREPETEKIGAFLARARQREGGVLLVSGEAGVGKTRLLEAARRLGRAENMTVLRVACQDRDRGVPYAPWVEILRGYVADTPRAEVYRTVSAHLGALAKLAPELQDRVWLHDPDAPIPAEWERRNFLAAIAQFFVAVAEGGPLLIALDDVGWADAASLELLETIARIGRSSPIALVGAYRDTHLDDNPGLQALLFGLERERWATTLQVRPLDPSGMRQLVGSVLERKDVSRDLLDLLYAKTRGNPFYTGEILQSLADQGSIYRTPEGWAWKPVSQILLPATVAGTIAGRLQRLDEESLRVLRVASLLGLEFSFDLLEHVADLPQERLLTALEHAQRARLVRERATSGPGIEYEFAHPLIQEVLEGEVSQVRARIIHLRAAHELERSFGAGAPEHAAVLAYHYVRGNDSERALRYSVEAGDRSAAVFARAEAAGHYRTTLRLLEKEDRPELRCRVQEALADQERGLAEVEQATARYEEAADGWEKLGRRAAAADCLRRAADCSPGPLDHVFALLDRSRRLLDSEPPGRPLVLWYLSHGPAIFDQGRVAEADAGYQKALALARSIGDHRGEAAALLHMAYCVPAERRPEFSSLDDEAEKIVTAHQLLDESRELYFGRAIYAYHCLGETKVYLGILDAITSFARKLGDVELESYMDGFAFPWVAVRTGEFRQGLERVEERRLRHRALGLTGWAPEVEAVGVRSWLAILLGPLDRGEKFLEDAFEAERQHPVWRAEAMNHQFRARLRLAQGRPREAIDSLEESRRVYWRGGPTAWHTLFLAESLRLLVRAAFEAGDATRAQEAADELTKLAEKFDSPPVWAFAWRGEAACRTAAKDSPSAVALLERSREIWERLGWKYDLASTWLEIGEAHAAGGSGGPAKEAFESALRLFREIGAEPDIERTQARAR
jgi:tetratricopeptide (TPR) repeat protein